MLKRVGILIPAYNPDDKLIDLLLTLNKKQLFNALRVKTTVLVVDDGSYKDESKKIFDEIEKAKIAKVIVHNKNLGKGNAIKTGIKHFKKYEHDTVVTVDADGQHRTKDILSVLNHSLENNNFVLGIRSFRDKTVPFKSRVGNNLSSFLFYYFTGSSIKDTQTGLRVIPKKLFDKLISIKGNRYEYEFNMLIELVRSDTPILTYPITTIYFENNKKTSFRPVFDSLLVYSVFLKYSIVAVTISILDLFLMYAVTKIYPTSASFLIIRGVTAHLYFYMMKKHVFNSEGNTLRQLSLYYLIVLANIFIFWQVFDILFFRSHFNFFTGYFMAVLSMFVFNFFIQKLLVFK